VRRGHEYIEEVDEITTENVVDEYTLVFGKRIRYDLVDIWVLLVPVQPLLLIVGLP